MSFLEYVARLYLGEPSGGYFQCPWVEHTNPSVVLNDLDGTHALKFRCHRCNRFGDEADIVWAFHPHTKYPQRLTILHNLTLDWKAGIVTKLPEGAPISPMGKTAPEPPTDWADRAREFATRFRAASHQMDLAKLLRVPPIAFRSLPLIGYDQDRDVFTFPEEDALGRVIGITQRWRDGTKRVIAGGFRGLTIPIGWREQSGPILVPEGASDVLALSMARLRSVGRPSNNAGAAHLISLFQDLPLRDEIIVLGENDQKSDGRWPGRDGAQIIVAKLRANLRNPIRVAFPPIEVKDARDWLTDPNQSQMDWEERGERFLKVLSSRH